MAPARDRVETLERRRRDRQLRSLGRRERGEEERDGRVDPGDQRGPALGLQLGGGNGGRSPAVPVRTEDPALRGRDEALRGVAVAAPEGAPAQTDEQMPPSGVHPFTLERDEDLRNVPPATPHSAAI